VDGLEATRAIRRWEAQQQRPPTPIIAITADAFDDDRRRCLRAGMNGFLSKPVQYPQLLQCIDQLRPRSTRADPHLGAADAATPLPAEGSGE